MKSEREKQIPYDITSMWNLKYDTDDPTKQKQITDMGSKQTCGCQGEGGGTGMDAGFGVGGCKL